MRYRALSLAIFGIAETWENHYRQNSLYDTGYITIHLVLRSTRLGQALFGVTNDNVAFDDIAKLYHQYRYNQLYEKGVYLALMREIYTL